jgi:hypothetical protein
VAARQGREGSLGLRQPEHAHDWGVLRGLRSSHGKRTGPSAGISPYTSIGVITCLSCSATVLLPAAGAPVKYTTS